MTLQSIIYAVLINKLQLVIYMLLLSKLPVNWTKNCREKMV